MIRYILLALCATVFRTALAAPTDASAAVAVPPNLGTFVHLRVEGANRTIFEDLVFTRGHDVTSASGVKLGCNGTNDHANPLPGPTCTSALDDASKLGHFTWDGWVFLLLRTLVSARPSSQMTDQPCTEPSSPNSTTS